MTHLDAARPAATPSATPVQPARPGFEVKVKADQEQVRVMVRDFGRWRDRLSPNSHLGGMGFALMGSLMDEVRLKRTEAGTFVLMQRAVRGKRFMPEASRDPPRRITRSSREMVETR
jgi:hypothetical protein